MILRIPVRACFAAIGAVCVALLAAAWLLQYGPEKQQPCPLCVLQRYAYMALALVSFAAAIHHPRRTGALLYAFAAELLALCGLGWAAWQVTKGDTMLSCMTDPVGVFVNGLPSANWWPEFLFASGGCADKYPPLLGLSVPLWSLLCFTVLSLLTSALALQALRMEKR